ncbi:carboxymuconolactone decarboxylase family protein [Undibacterium umbellatum]|uniref:Carboxymuconolactone decarboxylase family protein n=1 Tax=Undibacterium umbellatum TaxID=2762300 RepID=A0ABR6ZHS8_9BURK|nr:carboxymuconolactone decarboxylase family protein [Undibacterium umbellatum]MBC3911265.1 carboxymuconolactone decarboxylase family protein [Undibacterium umbellatum]
MLSAYKLTLPALTIETASPSASALLKGAKANFGFVPNMFTHMAHVPGLLSTYFHGYEQFRANSGFTAVEQEVVFLTISIENGCEYCVSAHSMVADAMSKVPTDVTNALRDGKPVTDAKLAALATFTRTMVVTRGLPSQADVTQFLAAGYTETQILEVILAISLKTISNYTNHLAHTNVDAAFASHVWKDARAAK